MIDLKDKNWIGLGVAGNFTGHLEQAGELEDFKNVKTEEEDAPKGIFPFYVPNAKKPLGINPISSKTITLPKDTSLQVEPEVALLCEIKYNKKKEVTALKPTHFSAFNDCSIRNVQADKISQKKNWGTNSKGISTQWIDYSEINNYRISSFLIRDEEKITYGIDSPVNGYSYFDEKLINWLISKINNQKEQAPLENISEHLKTADYPEIAIISIGATRYTEEGENLYLKGSDHVEVNVYSPKKTTSLRAVVREDLSVPPLRDSLK